MPLPDFEDSGDLPAGVHRATMSEVLKRFGHGTPQRQLVTASLVRVHVDMAWHVFLEVLISQPRHLRRLSLRAQYLAFSSTVLPPYRENQT